MGQDLFSNLPPEIMIEILSRLPIISIVRCKCVCKLWLDLIKSDEFVKSHLSKSVPSLALSQWGTSSKPHQMLEFVDTQKSGLPLFNLSFSFIFPDEVSVHGSANGLLLLIKFEKMFICNPITREYIRLPSLIETPSQHTRVYRITLGFGVSNASGEYKVIAVFSECYVDPLTGVVRELDGYTFKVYTLGTGSWRRITRASGPPWGNDCVFLDGKLHWLICNGNDIECFDLETERFSTFSTPGFVGDGFRELCALGDHGLCVCDNTNDDAIVWMMKEYGDDKSWTKRFLIKKPCKRWGVINPIKIFKDGDILFAVEFSPKLYRCSIKTKTLREIHLPVSFHKFGSNHSIYTPSFFQLKTLSEENVTLF